MSSHWSRAKKFHYVIKKVSRLCPQKSLIIFYTQAFFDEIEYPVLTRSRLIECLRKIKKKLSLLLKYLRKVRVKNNEITLLLI